MFYLLLTVLLTVCLFIIFRYFSKYGVNTFQAIVVNYTVCIVAGASHIYWENDFRFPVEHFAGSWLPFGMLTGVLFIATFYLMARTTQTLGVSIATVSSKVSMALPVLASIFIFSSNTLLDFWQVAGIALAFVAVLLSSWPDKTKDNKSIGYLAWLLPLSVFLLNGLIDTGLNYSSKYHIQNDADNSAFTLTTFVMAGLVGWLVLSFKLIAGSRFQFKDLLGGIVLGIPNYASLYFLIATLRAFDSNGALVFPLLNIGIILISALLGGLLFSEKLSTANKIGIGIALVAILLLAHRELL